MKVVLNSRIYVKGDARERALDSVRSVIGHKVENLEFDHEVRLRDDSRVEVEGVGDDAEAAINLLSREFGKMVTDPNEGGKYRGTLERWDNEGFTVDIGREVLVPRESLGDLGTGTPYQIRERFGLVQHLPLEIVCEGDEAFLSEDQVDLLWSWKKSPNGRLNINSCTRSEVRATVNRAGHAQDIVTVERLGFLEQSVVCRESTDPPGLLSSVGKYIKGEMMCVVSG